MAFIPQECAFSYSHKRVKTVNHFMLCGQQTDLTCELSERCVWLEVKTLSVFVEWLQAELSGLFYCAHSDFGHNSIDVVASTDLQDKDNSMSSRNAGFF